ncbi:MAG: hypothetical protein ACR2P1_20990 [Pseudomonadales bacterium]
MSRNADPPPAQKVQKRDGSFTTKTATNIWFEEPASENSYLVENAFCHGYNLIDLIRKRSFADTVYLLLRGELPNKEQSELFGCLMVAFMSPGPRHPATRAAVLAAVGKTDPALILPLSLSILTGENYGAYDVLPAMRFIVRNSRKAPQQVAEDIVKQVKDDSETAVPGFGNLFNGVDPLTNKIADTLTQLPGAGECMHWSVSFVAELRRANIGWLPTGLFAAVLCDLGFNPKLGAGLYQLCSAPGLLAHGMEFVGKPLTSVPFPDDDHYHIETEIVE